MDSLTKQAKIKMLKLSSKFESVVVLKTYKFVTEKCWKGEKYLSAKEANT